MFRKKKLKYFIGNLITIYLKIHDKQFLENTLKKFLDGKQAEKSNFQNRLI